MAAWIMHKHFGWKVSEFSVTISLSPFERGGGSGKHLLRHPNHRIKSSTSEEYVIKSYSVPQDAKDIKLTGRKEIRKALETRLQPVPCGHDGLDPNFLTSMSLIVLGLAFPVQRVILCLGNGCTSVRHNSHRYTIHCNRSYVWNCKFM